MGILFVYLLCTLWHTHIRLTRVTAMRTFVTPRPTISGADRHPGCLTVGVSDLPAGDPARSVRQRPGNSNDALDAARAHAGAAL